jgi:hypothetical protein
MSSQAASNQSIDFKDSMAEREGFEEDFEKA